MGFTVNGRTLQSLGVGETGAEQWSDGLRTSRDAFQRLGGLGGIASATRTVGARTIRVPGIVKGNTVATRNAVLEELVEHCHGRCEITPSDQPDKVVLGRDFRLRTLPVNDLLVFHRDAVRVVLEWTCYDPRYRSVNAHVVGFDATPRDVPMGTATHQGVIEVTGQPTDPVITVKDFRGTVVASIGLTGTLAADEVWIVDLEEHSVTLSDSGVESAAESVVSSGGFWRFLPEWAKWSSSAWPTIEIDAGEASLTYYRRWET